METQVGAGADIFDYLVDQVFVPLGLGPGAKSSLRTSDGGWTGAAFGGYDLWYVQDDVAKLGSFIAADEGAAGVTQLLDAVALDAALQQEPGDHGYATTGSAPRMYNNGFWGREFTTAEGYACNFWVPFASGFGGITVAMMPNGVTYYYLSDNGELEWSEAVAEVDRGIFSLDSGPYCTAGGGDDEMHVGDIAMSSQQFGGNRWQVEATVTVVDDGGAPVSGVTVDGSFTGATSSSPSGVADANGQVTLVSGKKKNGGTWTFCVDDLSRTGWNYVTGANVETCDNVTAP